ncbi:MAG: pitrilysin family protein [Pseudomonadota bacterium]|nr:pitrilysin family protein [Pseudomonadota bacterium]
MNPLGKSAPRQRNRAYLHRGPGTATREGRREGGALRAVLSVLLLAAFFFTTAAPAAAGPPLPDPDRLSYPPLRFSPPVPEHFTTANGLEVYFLPNRELPVVQATLLVKSGAMYDEQGKEGTAELTATLMRAGGTKDMAPRSLDDTLSSLAATIEPSVGMERTQWALFSLRKDFAKVWGIFHQILRTPRFDLERLALLKELKGEEIRRLPDDPQHWAFKEFFRLLHQGNPRGRLPKVSTLKDITREDIESCHRRHYSPDNMFLAISGAIDREEVERIVAETFGAWPARSGRTPVAPPSSSFPGAKYYLLKDSPQTITLIGRPAPTKQSPDYFPFDVADHILGSGGFRSRIFQQVRTDRGLAYATGSFYRAREDYGVFGAYAITKTSAAAEALTAIQDLVRTVRLSGVTSEETARAKSSILNSFLFSFTTPQQLVQQQASLAFEGLPADFLWEYRERVARLTVADIDHAAARWLDLDRSLILMLGSEGGYEEIKKTHPDFKIIKVSHD